MKGEVQTIEDADIFITEQALKKYLSGIYELDFSTLEEFKKLFLLDKFLNKNGFDKIVLYIAVKELLVSINHDLIILNPSLGELIELKYFSAEALSNREIFGALEITESSFYRQHNQALKKLTIILNERERAERTRRIIETEYQLGSNQTLNFIDTKGRMEKFVKELSMPNDSKTIILSGLGGIGKTTLAEKGIKKSLPELQAKDFFRINLANGIFRGDQFFQQIYENINVNINQRAKNKEIEREVAQHLKANSSLIFIDGLEFGLLDLLAIVSKLVSTKNRFVITSREEPNQFSSAIVHIRLDPLTFEEVKQLLETETTIILGENPQISFSEKEVSKLYKAIGGNPLAIKLIVGLLTELSKNEIFEDLSKMSHPDTYEMYTRVYQRVWSSLQQNSQSVLIALAMIENTTLSHTSLKWTLDKLNVQLDDSEIMHATSELKNRSLIEVYPGIEGQITQFGIHNLTKLFIQHEIYDKMNIS